MGDNMTHSLKKFSIALWNCAKIGFVAGSILSGFYAFVVIMFSL